MTAGDLVLVMFDGECVLGTFVGEAHGIVTVNARGTFRAFPSTSVHPA